MGTDMVHNLLLHQIEFDLLLLYYVLLLTPFE